ncbi:hypothetical protein ASG25_21150 [Rhizobium sp. Leaf384]|nr:hypothetical protein ASG25_21150 [Rhizobium sp. Leaf384]KQS83949.1 hypothetical protein ASG58_21530 [Rhizobium sp. Leaf383]
MDFTHRYDSARRVRDEKVRTRSSTEFDITNPFHLRAADEARMIRERVEVGYRLTFRREIAGRVREPFTEEGLKSVDNPVLKLFVSRLPRKGQIRASDNKADLVLPYFSKLLTLDCAYIEGRKTSLSFVRLDCDTVFTSTAACVAVLQSKVDAGEIPHLPHIIVGDTLDDGCFATPHFIFMLQDSVWNDKLDERCRSSPVKLFEAVYGGFVNALIDIGVDPCAPSKTARCKNPVSPIWTTLTPNATHFMSLSQYVGVLNTKSTRIERTRRAAELQSRLGKTASNELYNKLWDFGSRLLATWHFDADDRMGHTAEELSESLFVALEEYAADTGLQQERSSYVVGKVAEYLATSFNPSKLGKAKVRQRLSHLVHDVCTTEERQRIGAEYASKVRSDKTIEKLKEAVIRLKAAGQFEGLSKELISVRTGVSRATVYKHLAAVLADV